MTDRLRLLDLFSGIGGLSLGIERSGGFVPSRSARSTPSVESNWPVCGPM